MGKVEESCEKYSVGIKRQIFNLILNRYIHFNAQLCAWLKYKS